MMILVCANEVRTNISKKIKRYLQLSIIYTRGMQ